MMDRCNESAGQTVKPLWKGRAGGYAAAASSRWTPRDMVGGHGPDGPRFARSHSCGSPCAGWILARSFIATPVKAPLSRSSATWYGSRDTSRQQSSPSTSKTRSMGPYRRLPKVPISFREPFRTKHRERLRRCKRVHTWSPGVEQQVKTGLDTPRAYRAGALGWTEGDNLAIEWRFAEGRTELVPDLAAELAHLPVDVLFAAAAGPAVVEPRTSGVPIVAGFMSDPPAWGIQNLARPGGNVTGFSNGARYDGITSVELLKMVLPQLERLIILGDPTVGTFAATMATRAQTAQALGIQVLSLAVQSVDDVDAALATAVVWSAEALAIIGTANFTAGVYARTAELAAQHRLPAMFGFGPVVTDQGGLMSYSTEVLSQYRQGAEYVDKILRGAKPADLPVEEPREYAF